MGYIVITGIYQIQSKIKPNRIYVGSALSIKKRWNDHVCELRKNKHGNGKLQNHYNKYEESDLQFSILLGCDKEELIKNEQFFIDSLNPYFNIARIAGSNLGMKMSDESRQRISKAKKGIKLTEERRLKMSQWLIGHKSHPHTEETKAKLSMLLKGKSAPNKGKKMSLESRSKLSNSRKGMKLTEEHKRNIGQAHKGNKYCLGIKLSDEQKRQIALRMKGHKTSDATKQKIAFKNSLTKNTEEGRRRMQEAWNKRRINKLKTA